MAVPTTSDEFLVCLRKSNLLSSDLLAQCVEVWPSLSRDAAKAAGSLVRRGVLSEYQARLILSGRYRGFHIGPYVIQAEIGRGGMGAVYLAEHSALRRKAALKVVLADKAENPAALERFLREARSAAALDHKNIVRVFDILRQGSAHWLVMEYVDGITLDKLLQVQGVLPIAEASDYAAQTAAGLQHAYEKGFVHRDIKPANLMVSRTGVVKLLDMGLARAMFMDDQLTARLDRGAILGTADYIAPEQAIQGSSVDIRADLYSLGVTLFLLVTGRPPFPGNTTQKLIHHQRTPAPSITDFDPTLPAGLAHIVRRLMAKKPGERYQTPRELIDALTPWLSSHHTSSGNLSGNLSGVGLIPRSENDTFTRLGAASTNRIPRTVS